MRDDPFDSLAGPWRTVFDEAWRSFQAGNFGIGAALVDPTDDTIVTTGRNRVAQRVPQPGVLSGNMTAHAEMNAFAALTRLNAEGLHLYTTLEPCLMCAATAMQMKVSHVHFAAEDEFYRGMEQLWPSFHVTAERQPNTTGPLDGALARLGRLLPMVFTLQHFPGRAAEQRARAEHPELAATIDRMFDDHGFAEIVRTGSVVDAVRSLEL